MTEGQQKVQLTQEILIHSATWWMTEVEKIAFLTQTIIAMAVITSNPDKE